jgi:hypothetical protein
MGSYLLPTVDKPAGALSFARLAFQPLFEVTEGAQTGSHPALGRGLPGGPVRVPRTMLPGGRGPRRVAPVRCAGRSTVHLALAVERVSSRVFNETVMTATWPGVTGQFGQ